MAAIIRVKRRLDEDPAESLIVAYKKSKIDSDKADEPGTLRLSLITTVKSKDAALSRPLQKTLRRQQLQADYKSHGFKQVDHSQARAENSAKSKANRYRIVNSKRALTTTEGEEVEEEEEAKADSPSQTEKEKKTGEADTVSRVPSSDPEAQPSNDTESSPVSVGGASSEGDDPVIHDVEVDTNDNAREMVQVAAPSSGVSGITLNGQLLVSRQALPESESTFVYDLYYINNIRGEQYDFRDIENILSIEALHDTLVVEADRNEECTEVYEDEDDSNDENNWRNDYPDGDPDADDDTDVEFDEDFLEGQESRSYRDTLNDDILAEAMGTRLRLYGSDASSGGEGSDDDEDAYEDDDDKSRGVHRSSSSYKSYMRRVTRELNGELSGSDDDD